MWGVPCPFCAKPIEPGQKWHVDHIKPRATHPELTRFNLPRSRPASSRRELHGRAEADPAGTW